MLRGLPEYQSTVYVAQIMQNYLDLSIAELSKFKNEVSLQNLLRNNTDLIRLVEATAAATPEALELLLTQPMSIQQVLTAACLKLPFPYFYLNISLTTTMNKFWFSTSEDVCHWICIRHTCM